MTNEQLTITMPTKVFGVIVAAAVIAILWFMFSGPSTWSECVQEQLAKSKNTSERAASLIAASCSRQFPPRRDRKAAASPSAVVPRRAPDPNLPLCGEEGTQIIGFVWGECNASTQ